MPRHIVAPHAGAWVETPPTICRSSRAVVAPHAGAWVETRHRRCRERSVSASLPMRERGLKPSAFIMAASFFVAPHAGAWVETGATSFISTSWVSLPMRERGLKQELYRNF